MKFKVIFPTGFVVNDKFDCNIDINVVIEDGKVFFATFFTLKNIEKLLKNCEYFRAADMVILSELTESSIKKAITKMIADDYIDVDMSYIGEFEDIFDRAFEFEKVINMV